MFPAAGPRPTAAPAGPAARSTPGYLLMPIGLIADLADNLVAIGVYALIARRFLVAWAPVPLSASDLLTYDETLSRGSAVRALNRLMASGWLVEDAARGRKTRYTPAWSVIGGQPRPWTLDTPQLGLPRHHRARRLDRRLLDMYMGRLDPHPVHQAHVTRYLTRQLLGLADVGAYARALAGFEATTPQLTRLGLVRDGQACELPDDGTILAQGSQQTLFDPAGASLSVHGMRWFGVTPAPVADSAKPLFFVPREVIGGITGGITGGMIGGMIGQMPSPEAAFTASECAEMPQAESLSRSIANPGNLANPSEPTPPTQATAGEGGIEISSQNVGQEPPTMPAPQPRSAPAGRQRRAAKAPATETAALLKEFGVRSAAVAELADAPVESVRAAMTHARSHTGVRDMAGWVVALLRDARDHGWEIPAPATPSPQQPVAAPAAPPDTLATLSVEAALAQAQATPAETLEAAPPMTPRDDTCRCDGTGMYLLAVPYGHPQFGKLQICPCRRDRPVREALARTAGPALATAALAALRVEDRPYADVRWAGRTFTPDEQCATLRYAIRRGAAAGGAMRGACLAGPPGSGKTTIAVAAARELAQSCGLALRYASVPQLLDDLRREVAERAPHVLLQQHIDTPVLVLDDLGRAQLTAFARAQLYRLLDERLRRHTPDSPRVTFITTNLSFAELYALDPALASRIAAHTEALLCVASDYRLHAAAPARE